MVNEAAEISGLGERLKDKTKAYSKGMKRRLLVARALMVKPKLAILDEPTSGLDVIHAYHVRDIIKKYVKEHGVTVLLSSHNMLEVEHLCGRLLL
jgi:ABC-2 type transport system ATP-binding protein